MTEFFGPWSEDGGEEGEEVTTVEETVETFTTTTKKTRSVPVRRRHLVLDRDLRKRIFVATYLDSHDFKFRDLDFLGKRLEYFYCECIIVEVFILAGVTVSMQP